MLEHLFGSSTRVKLLSLFVRHPNEALFVREITRRVKTQINAVRRELANLTALGLLMEVKGEPEEKGKKQAAGLKRKYYQVDRSFKLLTEVTGLVIKAQVLLEHKLDKDISQLGDVRYLAFLGSFIGQARSSVDIFIVGSVDKKALKSLMTKTEQDLGFDINFSLMTPDEFLYRKDITDRFLYAILESPKHVAIDRLGERVV